MFEKGLNHRIYSHLFSVVVMLAVLIGSVGFPTIVHAFGVTITVFTNADNTTTDTLCSLREAITNANNNAQTYPDCPTGFGGEFIIFNGTIGSTITLTSPLPTITDPLGLTINGGGRMIISGNDLYRVFNTANVPLTLDGLTVTHGRGNVSGGGAYVNPGGSLTILNSTFSNNSAPDIDGVGGGVNSYGTLVITNSTFFLNSAVGTGGGVLVSGGSLTITNSTFSSNSSGYGGGVRNYGSPITITKSTFSGNSASSYGGGIYNPAGSLAISESTFSTNTAGAGGGIGNEGLLTIANSTFFGNSASIGGGISNAFIGANIGSVYITNSTFSNNTAVTRGGGIYNISTLGLSNTILADNTGGDCDNQDTLANSTNNLIKNTATACGMTNGVNGNIIGSDPSLGPGTGSPVYLPLNGGSLAINAGDNAKCAAAPVNNISQNGLPRPQGVNCDIGAYEADVTPPTVLSILPAGPNPTSAASVTFTVTFSEPVYGVDLSDFVLTQTGITGGAVTGVSAITASTYTVIVTTGSGSGTLRLDVVDHDTILDLANLYLGGTGNGNGSFTNGTPYDIRFYHFYLALVLR